MRRRSAALMRVAASGSPAARGRRPPAGSSTRADARCSPRRAREKDPEILATVAFSTGQLKDAAAIPWLAGLLSAPATPPAAAFEAARALGKIRVARGARRAGHIPHRRAGDAAAAPVVGEALLSIGRFPPPGDIAPIVRWTTSPNVEVRWRAAWALFRPRDPAAVPHLLRLATDTIARGPLLGRARAAARPVDAAKPGSTTVASARLREARQGPRSPRPHRGAARARADTTTTRRSQWCWRRSTRRTRGCRSPPPKASAGSRPARTSWCRSSWRRSAPSRPLALRITALTPLAALAPEAATTLAQSLAEDAAPSPGDGDADARAPRRTAARAAGARAAPAAPRRPSRRTDAEYRDIVERWIVADYNGAAKPRVILETPRGAIEIELYAGDAPLGLDYLVRVVESGEIVGTEFGRVVPNFVAQQRAIRDDGTLRDEVNRRGLLRGTLSWASAGLDTGRPGYTLGNTPQPHNEGDFTVARPRRPRHGRRRSARARRQGYGARIRR